MKKFLESNLFYGIVALVLAVFLLFYVDSAENPIQEKTFYNVDITVSNLAEGYLLENEPGLAEIRVRGYKSVLNTVSSRDIKARVDLRDAETGPGSYPVQVSLPSGLDLVSQRPASIELIVDAMGEKTLPITCLTQNAVSEGYGSLEPVATPGMVTITGPRMVLERVVTARVVIDLKGRTEDYWGTLPVTLLDEEDMEVQDARLSLSADNVQIHVVVTENLSSKSVQVRTALTGEINEKYTVTSVEVQPSTVKITGPYSTINWIDNLTTEPVDLSEITETFQGKVRLMVPEDVEVLEGNQVTLTIRIEENLSLRQFTGIPVEVRNALAGRRYGTIPLTVDVTLGAYPWIFANASNDAGAYDIEIKAYIDLAGQAASTQNYTVMLEFPEEYRLMAISSETVRLYAD